MKEDVARTAELSAEANRKLSEIVDMLYELSRSCEGDPRAKSIRALLCDSARKIEFSQIGLDEIQEAASRYLDGGAT